MGYTHAQGRRITLMEMAFKGAKVVGYECLVVSTSSFIRLQEICSVCWQKEVVSS